MVVVASGRLGQTFNVLPEGVSDFTGPDASDFGFSVALWRDVAVPFYLPFGGFIVSETHVGD
ncbi:hypothetical protein E2C01_066827 [Portunus trituberculatus]|uniref:Uncharacterized protein n=1 Tax=Portunus trituberculatus TaxID=210409 RepID=A0A5B7HTD7_PORTR|nr:hypothetical protein [Portunus trituberculatus]